MTLSASLENNPDIDSWLQFHSDGKITVSTGKVELGQKLITAFTLIVAEELDVVPARISVITADTSKSPNEGYTAGSNSIESSGMALRQVAAKVRQILLEKASQQLGVPVENLNVDDGEISSSSTNLSVTYLELIGGKNFNIKVSEQVMPKKHDQYHLIGNKVPGIGYEDLVTGATTFVQDLELPGMLHARVVRPPGYHARLQELNEKDVREMPGVVGLVVDGSFLAVVCEREEQAVQASKRLSGLAVWDESREINTENIFIQLKKNTRQSLPVVKGVAELSAVPSIKTPPNSAKTITATFQRPYHMHGSLAPSTAMALYNDQEIKVWTHSQGVYPLRDALADVLEIEENSIHVMQIPGAGCYGHNGADDVALDAVLVARAFPGKPVLLKWERADEHSWEPYGSAMQIELKANLDKSGKVLYWNHETYSDTHLQRPSANGKKSRLLASWHLKAPKQAPQVMPITGYHIGIHRNADPIYNFHDRRIIKHLVPSLPLRVSTLRSLGAYANVFAIESFMDELAHSCGRDPLDFRMDYLSDYRAKAVLEAAVEKANSRIISKGVEQGRGFALARYKNAKCYAAVAVDVLVNDYGAIKLLKAVIAADAGQVIDPDGLRSQLEGGLIQSASWTLKEQVKYDEKGITSKDWETYPIMTFGEVPEIETILIDRKDSPVLGAGEATQGPTAAAISNAVFDAVGIRLRRIPFTPEIVLEAAAKA